MSQTPKRNTPSPGRRDPEAEQYHRQARKQSILRAGTMQAIGILTFVFAALAHLMSGFGTAETVIFLAIGTLAVALGFFLLLQAFDAVSGRTLRTGRIVLAGAFGVVIVAAFINLVV